MPWELHELPRQLHPNVGDYFGAPPPRVQRARQPKDLPTINERPSHGKSPLSQAQPATSSSTDLRSEPRHSHEGLAADDDGSILSGKDGDRSDGPRKVQKGQINALAKMLSALRR